MDYTVELMFTVTVTGPDGRQTITGTPKELYRLVIDVLEGLHDYDPEEYTTCSECQSIVGREYADDFLSDDVMAVSAP